ncbi:hypothetical protein [Rhodococcus sp. YH3-3]|uniref:hypothetical protein n=1 Tax=Rhodococcus sp. YH3-3 TaxID=1803579 RepID=UPI000AB9DB5B|nr:hypothetical protein [Rhodococcus sp. YH3-3]
MAGTPKGQSTWTVDNFPLIADHDSFRPGGTVTLLKAAKHYLWRAVGQDGNAVGVLVQSRRKCEDSQTIRSDDLRGTSLHFVGAVSTHTARAIWRLSQSEIHWIALRPASSTMSVL